MASGRVFELHSREIVNNLVLCGGYRLSAILWVWLAHTIIWRCVSFSLLSGLHAGALGDGLFLWSFLLRYLLPWLNLDYIYLRASPVLSLGLHIGFISTLRRYILHFSYGFFYCLLYWFSSRFSFRLLITITVLDFSITLVPSLYLVLCPASLCHRLRLWRVHILLIHLLPQVFSITLTPCKITLSASFLSILNPSV